MYSRVELEEVPVVTAVEVQEIPKPRIHLIGWRGEYRDSRREVTSAFLARSR